MTDRELKIAVAYIEAREAFYKGLEFFRPLPEPVLKAFETWQAEYLYGLPWGERQMLASLIKFKFLPDSHQCAQGGPLLAWIAKHTEKNNA